MQHCTEIPYDEMPVAHRNLMETMELLGELEQRSAGSAISRVNSSEVR